MALRPTLTTTLRLGPSKRSLHLTGPSTFSHLPPRPSRPIALHTPPPQQGARTIDAISLPSLFATSPDSPYHVPLLSVTSSVTTVDEIPVMKAQIHAQTPEAVSPVVELCDAGQRMDFVGMAARRHGAAEPTPQESEGVVERIINSVGGVFGGRVTAA